MTDYQQEELTSFWGRLTPYLAILESRQDGSVEPIGRVTIDADDHQAFALHTTDVKAPGDTSEIPTGRSATYSRTRVDGADWGPWLGKAYQ